MNIWRRHHERSAFNTSMTWLRVCWMCMSALTLTQKNFTEEVEKLWTGVTVMFFWIQNPIPSSCQKWKLLCIHRSKKKNVNKNVNFLQICFVFIIYREEKGKETFSVIWPIFGTMLYKKFLLFFFFLFFMLA